MFQKIAHFPYAMSVILHISQALTWIYVIFTSSSAKLITLVTTCTVKTFFMVFWIDSFSIQFIAV